MKSGSFPFKFLVQLTLVFLVNFINAGNLDFYQDVEPEVPEEITYKQVARYLESQNHKQRGGGLQRSRMLPNLPWPYSEFRGYEYEKEKILESLLENPAILDILQNEKIKNREEVKNWRRRAYDIGEDVAAVPSRSYKNVNSVPNRLGIYSNVNILPHISQEFFANEKSNYPDNSANPLRSNFPESENYPVDNVETENLLKLQGKLINLNGNRAKMKETKSFEINEPEPEFTFKFDAPKFTERVTFAIRPNDPRYYEDDAKTRSTSVDMNYEMTTKESNFFESIEEQRLKPFEKIVETEPKIDNEYSPDTHNIIRDKFSLMKVIMPDRRAERDPLLVSSTLVSNNDIYFIAIVAGCSAAAMFALVLIALTWCRLHRGAKAAADIEYPAYGVTGPNKDISPSGDQRLAHSAQILHRGAKAAADIEYPAYGVTGPNKDISPSGDQRLAHSAQMYHFQHQKQQIIAMENRTAASRDPGSVSEAESDEENEEGDYTVYECPGLASTGEMEVKNPMFLDDPTPATPPQIHKEEDHM